MSILVPLDLSETAVLALPVASRLATALGEDLVLITIVDDRVRHELEVMHRVTGDDVEREVEHRLGAIASDLGGSVACEVRIAGSAAPAIVDRAGADEVSMIVISSSGRSGVSRMLMGSVAEAVTRKSPVPVVVVPAGPP